MYSPRGAGMIVGPGPAGPSPCPKRVKLLPRCLAASLLIALAGWPAGGVATSGPGAGRADSRPAAPAAALDREAALTQALAREVEGAKKVARTLGVHVVDLAD